MSKLNLLGLQVKKCFFSNKQTFCQLSLRTVVRLGFSGSSSLTLCVTFRCCCYIQVYTPFNLQKVAWLLLCLLTEKSSSTFSLLCPSSLPGIKSFSISSTYPDRAKSPWFHHCRVLMCLKVMSQVPQWSLTVCPLELTSFHALWSPSRKLGTSNKEVNDTSTDSKSAAIGSCRWHWPSKTPNFYTAPTSLQVEQTSSI